MKFESKKANEFYNETKKNLEDAIEKLGKEIEEDALTFGKKLELTKAKIEKMCDITEVAHEIDIKERILNNDNAILADISSSDSIN